MVVTSIMTPLCREDAYSKFNFYSPSPESPPPTDTWPEVRAPSLPSVPPRPPSTFQSSDVIHRRSPSGSGPSTPSLPPLPPGGVEAVLRPPILSPRPRDHSPVPSTTDGPVVPPIPVPRRAVSVLLSVLQSVGQLSCEGVSYFSCPAVQTAEHICPSFSAKPLSRVVYVVQRRDAP